MRAVRGRLTDDDLAPPPAAPPRGPPRPRSLGSQRNHQLQGGFAGSSTLPDDLLGRSPEPRTGHEGWGQWEGRAAPYVRAGLWQAINAVSWLGACSSSTKQAHETLELTLRQDRDKPHHDMHLTLRHSVHLMSSTRCTVFHAMCRIHPRAPASPHVPSAGHAVACWPRAACGTAGSSA